MIDSAPIYHTICPKCGAREYPMTANETSASHVCDRVHNTMTIGHNEPRPAQPNRHERRKAKALGV